MSREQLTRNRQGEKNPSKNQGEIKLSEGRKKSRYKGGAVGMN